MATDKELNVILGTGPLGMAVMQELIKKGRKVRMVNRSGKAEVPAGVEVSKGDVTNLEGAREACRGAATIYMCAQPGYTRWVEEFPAYMAGAIEGAASARAKLIFGDNLYMYGEVDGPITESLPYKAHTRKGKVRAEIAESLMQAHRNGKIRATIGRASDFFGPRVLDSVLGDRVFYPAIAGKTASAAGNLDLPHTYTYIEDFGRGLVTLGENEEAFGQFWHIPNAPTITTRQFLNMVFEELNLPPKMSGMGKMMLWIGGLFVPEAKEMIEMAYEFEKPFVVSHAKFEQAFGANPTPHREAIRNTLEWYRAHPHVKA